MTKKRVDGVVLTLREHSLRGFWDSLENISLMKGAPMGQQTQTPELPLDVNAIQERIPHRYPFLLIDRVVEATPKERVVAIKNVSISDPVLQGHFPGNPVVPGVLIIEGIAQAAAVLGDMSLEKGCSSCFLTEIGSARFRRPVVPGDQMRYEVTVEKLRPPFFWFDAQCQVDGDMAAQTKISAMMK